MNVGRKLSDEAGENTESVYKGPYELNLWVSTLPEINRELLRVLIKNVTPSDLCFSTVSLAAAWRVDGDNFRCSCSLQENEGRSKEKGTVRMDRKEWSWKILSILKLRSFMIYSMQRVRFFKKGDQKWLLFFSLK